MKIIEFLSLIRVRQWIKNLFVFLPLFASGRFFEISSFQKSFIAFISFCLVASSIYCFNDVLDAEDDRNHPEKKFRPVASEKISKNTAIMVGLILLCLGICVSRLFLSVKCVGVLALYIVLNILYVFVFKHLAIIDLFVIAIGFVLRLWIDGVACDIYLSPWLVSMTFLLSLFVVIAKRFDDLKLRENGFEIKRKSSNQYTFSFLNQLLGMLSAITIVCYLMYSISLEVVERIGSDKLYLTSIFVIFGIFRYLYITMVQYKSGEPSVVIIKDKYLAASIFCWVITFACFIYLPKLA